MPCTATYGPDTLSNRETEVLDAVSERLTNAEIGRRLHISVRTVESHVSSLLRKLGAADRRELAVRAESLIAPDDGGPEDRRPITGTPSAWTSFIGRESELAAVASAVATDRLVTLVGPGGIGKTRLATAAVGLVHDDFPGGGAFVDLVPVSAELVVHAVAAALEIVERPRESLESLVHERLALGGRTLLVLDNCEHVLARTSTFVEGVLAACPDATVLTTSRECLGVAGELVLPVSGLGLTTATGGPPTSDAERLFIDRATSAAGVDASPVLVAELCRRLEGMPLAIELAAARSRSLGVDGLLSGIDDHLRILGTVGGSEHRHRSLRAVIDWSHDLLDDEECELFHRLGAFTSSFDIDAVTAVAADGDAALATDVVGRLADKSLLVRYRDDAGSRWRMLETVHAYAREQLDRSGRRDHVERLHLEWACAAALELERGLDDASWQPRFDAIADELRAALVVARRSGTDADCRAYDLARTLAHLSYARRFLAEAREHFDDAVGLAPNETEAVSALRAAAGAAHAEMRGDRAYDLLMEMSARAEAAGDLATAAIAMADAATVAGRAPATFERDVPHETLVSLVDRARELAPSHDLGVATHLAIAAAWNGRPGPTETDPSLASKALQLAREFGDAVCISDALDAVGCAALAAGRVREAARHTEERLTLLDRLPRHSPLVGGEVHDIYHMATESSLATGDLESALSAARASLHDISGKGVAHFAACHMVVPLALQGDFDAALAQAAAMEDGWHRSGRPPAGWMAPAFFAAALAHGMRGEAEGFTRWWDIGAAICLQTRPNSFSEYVAPRVALHIGDVEGAMRTLATFEPSCVGQYDLYAEALEVELAVVSGSADAEARLAKALGAAGQNDFADAHVARAVGRLYGDEEALLDAVARWERIGARFERACTLLLVPSRVEEGELELSALGCTLPRA